MTTTTHIQSLGNVPAIPTNELVVGDLTVWNSGQIDEVVAIEQTSPAFYTVHLRSGHDGIVRSRRLKATRLVAVAR